MQEQAVVSQSSISTPEQRYELQVRNVTIPIEVLKDKRITLRERILVVIIDMLDDEVQHCYAGNRYLADLVDYENESGVANALVKLRKAGWVRNVSDTPRRLTTALRDNRERLKSLTQMSIVPYSNEYEAVTQMSMINTSENNFLEREKRLRTIFRKCFPDYSPSAFQLDEIYTLVQDEALWELACQKWAGMGWQPRKTRGIVELYQRLEAEKKDPPKGEMSQHRIVIEDACPICSHPEFAATCPQHGGNN